MGVAKCNDVYARVYVCFQSGPFRNFDCFNLTLVTPLPHTTSPFPYNSLSQFVGGLLCIKQWRRTQNRPSPKLNRLL